MKTTWIAIFLAAMTISVGPLESADVPKTTTGSAGLSSGLNPANFDLSVRPQDDLYRFVNNGWLKSTPIPADKPNYGTFIMLFDQSLDRLKTIALRNWD